MSVLASVSQPLTLPQALQALDESLICIACAKVLELSSERYVERVIFHSFNIFFLAFFFFSPKLIPSCAFLSSVATVLLK